MKKYYAVKEGNKKGIFYGEWDDIKEIVDGYPGAKYRSFTNKIEAQEYMEVEDTNDDLNFNGDNSPSNELDNNEVIAYTDGSFDKEKNRYGYGVVILTKNGKDYLYRSFNDENGLKYRNISGELKGVMDAIDWSIDNKFDKLHIYYDYEGIKNWINEDWSAKSDVAKKYVSFVKEKKTYIEISFTKVKAHSGIEFNEEADKLAKNSLNNNKKYRTNKDGSFYVVGIDECRLKNVLDKLEDNFKERISIKKESQDCVHIIVNAYKVTLRLYNKLCVLVQGKKSNLLDNIVTLLLDELENTKYVIENLNAYYGTSITENEVDREFKRQMPNAYKREHDPKVLKVLKNSIFNTMFRGYKPDYTDLVTPVSRIMEHYLHESLGYLNLETRRVNKAGKITAGNNFSYFNLENGRFVLNRPENATAKQKAYIEELYNWYHNNRHEISHWEKESEDSVLVVSNIEALDKIKDGHKIIEKYYTIFQ